MLAQNLKISSEFCCGRLSRPHLSQHWRNLHHLRSPHHNIEMTLRPKCKLIVVLCGLACLSVAQQKVRTPKDTFPPSQVQRNTTADHQDMTITADDGLAIIAAALDSRVRLIAKRDCSHLVNAIYVRAGFPYTYVRSSDLYRGAIEFQRVTDPQPGDLVVWRGHVGIVVYPAQHIFFSAMRSGLGIDSYDAPYWKRRGQARFYRYMKLTFVTNSPTSFVQTHQN
jgi:NlpC/P60 family